MVSEKFFVPENVEVSDNASSSLRKCIHDGQLFSKVNEFSCRCLMSQGQRCSLHFEDLTPNKLLILVCGQPRDAFLLNGEAGGLAGGANKADQTSEAFVLGQPLFIAGVDLLHDDGDFE